MIENLNLLENLLNESCFFYSWSPDGAHVATANGAWGPVPISAIFNRSEWRPDISLVGHDSAIEVVVSIRIFLIYITFYNLF